LQDPDLKFHDRSAVDLKDRCVLFTGSCHSPLMPRRFRTYFPDAYQRHYPNARTHLSSKVRSTLADGTSLFEKTRSKRRRPFTEAEDRALRVGYEKHGTTWATIVKDPIFAEQNRRSTDLRDRFRNAFPDLYQAAGYKPRSASKKKLEGMGVIRAADDQLSTTAGPVRSRRRAQTSQGLLRGGTKSVPQSTACSEDEDSEEESENSPVFKTPPTPVFVENVSTASYRPSTKKSQTTTTTTTTNVPTLSSTADTQTLDVDDEMELVTLDSTDPLNIPDFLPNNVHSDMETWSSGLNTPTHSSTAAWSTAAVSPTSSHLSDFLMNATAGTGNTASSSSSPFIQRRVANLGGNSIDNNFGMIGKSAWGTQDWFSPNPRLDASNTSSSNSSSSFIDPANFSPASPFSFHPHNHGVLDRYDLFPPYMPDGNVSEAGLDNPHTPFSGELGFNGTGGGISGANGAGASTGGTGFKGYHSQIAGDLISGAGARMHHHHHHQSTTFSLSNLYGTSFGSAFGNAVADGAASAGLGLEGIPENVQSIHPMQLHSHAPSLSAIDELGLTGISLNDHVDSLAAENVTASGQNQASVDDAMDEGEEGLVHQQQPQSELQEKHDNDIDNGGVNASRDANEPEMEDSLPFGTFGMEDLVDMNELHATPPATPLVTHPRPMRRSSGSVLQSFDSGFGGGFGNAGGGGHARSISVPPSEARIGHHDVGMPMSMDDVGLHSMHGGYHGFGAMHSHVDMGGMMGRNLHSIFNMSSSSSSASGSISIQQQQQFQERQGQTVEPHQLSESTGSIRSPITPSAPLHQQHQHQPQQQQSQLDVEQNQHNSELTPLFPANLILSPSTTPGIPSSPPTPAHPNSSSSSGGGSNHHTPVIDNHHQRDELWRSAFPPPSNSSSSSLAADYSYNLPFLDLHYYYAGAGSMMFGNSNHTHGNVNQMHHYHHHHHHLHNSLGLDVPSMDGDLYSTTAEATRQGQALDLAQTHAQLGSLGAFNANVANLTLPVRPAFEGSTQSQSQSPSGTIRHHAHSGVLASRRKPLLDETFNPPVVARGSTIQPVAAGPGPGPAADVGSSNGNCNQNDSKYVGGTSNDSRVNGGRAVARTGTIRQTTKKAQAGAGPTTPTPTMGRSMSHHRGQSAASAASVCPQDLMLRSGDNKRKRASWDGGLV